MKILITGSKGQLGSEFRKISIDYKQFNWVFVDVEELDFCNLHELESSLSELGADIIVNCAAYTNVEKAEIEKDLAMKVNCLAVEILSNWSFRNGSKIIHISTDYVFDGNSKIPLNENAKTNPVNFYGLTKLKGENICLKNNPNSIIIRTSWLYSSNGNNFVKTIINLMSKKDTLNVIDDQIGSPTYAEDLAKTILKIINYKDWIPGVYHYSNEGEISWFNFASSIKKLIGFSTEINAISSNQFSSKASRPSYSLLDKSKIKKTFNITIPRFENSLKKCIKILNNEK